MPIGPSLIVAHGANLVGEEDVGEVTLGIDPEACAGESCVTPCLRTAHLGKVGIVEFCTLAVEAQSATAVGRTLRGEQSAGLFRQVAFASQLAAIGNHLDERGQRFGGSE